MFIKELAVTSKVPYFTKQILQACALIRSNIYQITFGVIFTQVTRYFNKCFLIFLIFDCIVAKLLNRKLLVVIK